MQSSLPAGWLAFTGRESNPLDHNKRFQITHPPFLDLSWRYRDELPLFGALTTDGGGELRLRCSRDRARKRGGHNETERAIEPNAAGHGCYLSPG
jgi:hypothetical protein